MSCEELGVFSVDLKGVVRSSLEVRGQGWMGANQSCWLDVGLVGLGGCVFSLTW